MPAEEHRAASPTTVRCSVITVSDTRTLATDRGGQLILDYLESAGHPIVQRTILRDEPEPMAATIREYAADTQAILLTGGTGISARDNTFETVSELIDKPLPGYGELFRMLSYEEIGAAAMLSRAIGGVFGNTIVLTMPGSTAAVRLAMERLILPELAHLVHEANK